ncbi:hypothetical protein DJ568_15380 [Mucilaginibacter hurinus]|uniref:Peptidase S24/S26A/S26B/S26C domain-containing protein n=1 Tax=Mucilaginibacter hurinus TaxID=2201324 RepID=A0A367GKC5_9SPHI|nr:S24/S26 family peptidase [Mucilaginibacter hurinus]RCH53919.1 hypothetical protein DJ568_15380 [Mucilaginibacter hurinus]
MEKEGEKHKLLLKGRGYEINDIALKLNMTRQNLGYHFRKDVLDSNFKEKLYQTFPEVFTNVKQTPEIAAISELPENMQGIPMYNIPVSASIVEMYGDAKDVKVVGHLHIPGASKESFALPVHGHSMYPTLENGSWCVLRPITDVRDIEWGEIYYIEYGDYRMYKRLLKDEDEDSVILWSDNQLDQINGKPKYAAKTIKKSRIRRLCLLTDILKKPNY